MNFIHLTLNLDNFYRAYIKGNGIQGLIGNNEEEEEELEIDPEELE
jgi:hypothetical protein